MNTFALQFSRFIRAPREKVFDAFVEPRALAAWHCPRGMAVPELAVDARAGGAWRIVMQARDGSRHIVGGRYVELRRADFLSYTWGWESGGPPGELQTLVEVSLAEKDGGTELSLRHSGFPNEALRDSHESGWTSVFNRLADLVDERGTAASLVLLGDGRSTYTRTVRMALAEKGLAYRHEPRAPHSPEVLAANPFGRIPVLYDGPIALFETSAILRYLDEGFDAPALLPQGLVERARCEQWISLYNGHYYEALVRRYVLQYVIPRGAGGQPDRAVIDAAVKEMPALLAPLERAWAAGPFLVGDRLTPADLMFAPVLAYLPMFPEGRQLLGDCPNIRRAQAAMAERASFKATAPG